MREKPLVVLRLLLLSLRAWELEAEALAAAHAPASHLAGNIKQTRLMLERILELTGRS